MPGFRDVIGNDLIKEVLKENIDTGRVSHAYLFTGEKGSGKKTLTRAFLLELFCSAPEAERPCLACPACKQVLSGNHPDICYVTPEKPGAISVDDIRKQVTDTVDIRPFSGQYKAYVIDEADKMTLQAQNALLKTLEEPPAYAVIILLAADETRLLDTIRSRVVRDKLKPLPDSAIREYMRENLNADEEKTEVCIAFARGNLGRAIELCNSPTFSEWYQRLMKIIRSIKQMTSAEMLVEIGKLQNECPDLMDALDLLQLWYRDLMMYMVTKDLNGLVFAGERQTLTNMAAVSTHVQIQEIMQSIEVCRERLRANVNPTLCLELLLLKLRDPN